MSYSANITILPRADLEPDRPAPTAYEPWRGHAERSAVDLLATDWPASCEARPPEQLLEAAFGCSGSMETSQYQEATRYRPLAAMDWAEARLALNRLATAVRNDRYIRETTRAEYMDLAEFALTAGHFDFAGKKGDAAPKFRREVANVIQHDLHRRLTRPLKATEDNITKTARPIVGLERYEANNALQAKVPLPDGSFVTVMQATAEQVLASLDYMRGWLAEHAEQRKGAEEIASRMADFPTGEAVTAQEYAGAVSTADALAFVSGKLAALYAGIAHAIPLYRLYPATPEREAIALWWPWGRPALLVAGGPAAPRASKAVLDPALITTTKPHKVVGEVIAQTGVDRTTAQRMTAKYRADLRRKRLALALSLLRAGETRATVAKTVGLSPSRISALFKDQTFPTKRKRAAAASSLQT